MNILSGNNIATFLAFLGIAITYLVTAIFDKSTTKSRIAVKRIFYCAAIFYFLVAILSLWTNTIKGVDAGIVLGYMGIGAGLMCAAWSVLDANIIVRWVAIIIGIVFEFIGLLLIVHAGLLGLTPTLVSIAVFIVTFVIIYRLGRKRVTT